MALGFIAFGFLLPAVVWSYYATITWIPLDSPINLTANEESAFSFKVNMSGNYRISIRTDRAMPFQELDCLLGLSQAQKLGTDCGHTAQVLDFNWKLYRSGDLLQQGKYGDSIGGGYSDKNIDAEFAYPTVKRGSYKLVITPTRDGSLLAPTHPRAHFEADNDYYVGSMIVHFGSLVFGVFLVIIGSGIMAIREWRERGKPKLQHET